MGFRFQKRIRLFKGLTLNLSKTGTSLTVGRPGASVNIRGNKVTGSVGVPGSGFSYRQTLSGGESQRQPRRFGSFRRLLFWVALLLVIGYLVGR